MNAKEKLDKYSDNLIGIASYEAEKDALKSSLIPDEIKDKLAEIDAEFDPKIGALREQNAKLSEELTAEALALGSTLSGNFHKVIVRKPTVTWNTEGLEAYALSHPEVLLFKRIGKPSAYLTFRR